MNSKEELTFPPAFEEHLKEIICEWDKEEREKIKDALRRCGSIGVTELKLDTCGCSDNSEWTDIEVYPENLCNELTEAIRDELRYYGSEMYKLFSSEYAVKGGGGCRCTITFYPFTIQGEAYCYVMEEHAGESFSLS